jgi:hypothetical protein
MTGSGFAIAEPIVFHSHAQQNLAFFVTRTRIGFRISGCTSFTRQSVHAYSCVLRQHHTRPFFAPHEARARIWPGR